MTMIIDGTNGLTFPDNSQQYNSYYGFKNRIINGAMVIDQRNAGAAVTTTGSSFYSLDRWTGYRSAAGWSIQQVADAPAGFVNSLKVTTTTASAGAVALVQQWFEGYNVADFGLGTASAATFTISFWVKSSVTGTFAGNVANGAINRAYIFTYTINSANTWEYKTVTIAGDTTGTWATNNTAGLRVLFNLGTGGNSSTAGSWQAGDLIRTSSSVGIEGTLNATWQITGVQLEKGSTATSFDYRPYGTELALCQRYYAKMSAAGKVYAGYATGLFASTTGGSIAGKYPVAMRSSPTIAASTCAVYDGNSVIAVTSLTTNYAGSDSFNIDFTVASGGTQFRPVNFVSNNSTAGFLEFSSEL